MAQESVFSHFMRVQLPDKTYALMLPVNTIDEVFTDLEKQTTLKDKLTAIDYAMARNNDSVYVDMLKMLQAMQGFVSKDVSLTHARIVSCDFSGSRDTWTGIKTDKAIFI